MSSEIYYRCVSELEAMLDRREISAVELLRVFMERKSAVDDKVGAFLSEYRHQSLKKLKEFEEWKQGEGGSIGTPDELIALIQGTIKKARG